MLSDSLVQSILQASLTGAGLVLAIYTLILPISEKLFEKRAKDLADTISEVKFKLDEVETTTTSEELDELRKSISEIEEKIGLPQYLGVGIGLTFSGFIVSCLMSIWWNIGYNFDFMDNNLPKVFGFTVALFLLIGIITIKDIYEILKTKYQVHKSIKSERASARIRIDQIRINTIKRDIQELIEERSKLLKRTRDSDRPISVINRRIRELEEELREIEDRGRARI